MSKEWPAPGFSTIYGVIIIVIVPTLGSIHSIQDPMSRQSGIILDGWKDSCRIGFSGRFWRRNILPRAVGAMKCPLCWLLIGWGRRKESAGCPYTYLHVWSISVDRNDYLLIPD